VNATTAAVFANDANSLIWWDWVGRHTDDIWERTVQHVELTLLTVGIGILVASLLTAVALRLRVTATPILWGTGLIYTIPSLALFGFLVPRLGLGYRTALVALVGYTLVILVRNMVAGMEGVPSDVREAATAMGLRPWRRFWRVELPVALPLVLAGVRTAVVQVMATATLASLFGYQALGSYLTEGLTQRDDAKLLTGTIAVGVLWIVAEATLGLLQWRLTPWVERRGRWSRRARPRPVDPAEGAPNTLPVP